MLLENLFPTGQYGDGGRAFMVRTGAGYHVKYASMSAAGVWSLTTAGVAALTAPQSTDVAPTAVFAAGTKNGATVSAMEYGVGEIVHKTVLTLAALSQTITNTTAEYAGSLIYTFPEGRILLLGAVASVAQTTTTTIATSIAAGATGAFALGSATASATSLTSTMVDMLPSSAYTSSAVIDTQAAVSTGALAVSAQFDGTATPVPVYFNSAIATGSINGTQTWNGTITLTWANLGDV